MQLSRTNGGTMEFTGLRMSRHFQILSNELSAPKLLRCPADKDRNAATNFTTDLTLDRLSYFVGLDASTTNPELLLAGDRNITNGTSLKRAT
ncbi:MAG: type II secretion system protein, partial [Akkermansiaceae bacterium]|nr:type II secretion system protein [Verrucomicrobiales bacterium]